MLRDSRWTRRSICTFVRQDFSLDPDLLRELNARYLHDINASRPTNVNPEGGALLLSPFLRAEHYHQHTHTDEHNLNIFTPPPNNALVNERVAVSIAFDRLDTDIGQTRE